MRTRLLIGNIRRTMTIVLRVRNCILSNIIYGTILNISPGIAGIIMLARPVGV